jgi:hypothetical protein
MKYQDVGPEPQNENETLLMLGKLQSYIRSIVPMFTLQEHTSQFGVDGLIDVQLTVDSLPDLSSTVEFEFELANFFTHQHPIRQTRYIACWQSAEIRFGNHRCGTAGLDRNGTIEFSYSGATWIHSLAFDNHRITVLVLKQVPGIQVGHLPPERFRL